LFLFFFRIHGAFSITPEEKTEWREARIDRVPKS
jgi:hypothetical protein